MVSLSSKKYLHAAGRKSQRAEGIPSVSRESFVSDKFRKGKSRLEQAFYFQPPSLRSVNEEGMRMTAGSQGEK